MKCEDTEGSEDTEKDDHRDTENTEGHGGKNFWVWEKLWRIPNHKY